MKVSLAFLSLIFNLILITETLNSQLQGRANQQYNHSNNSHLIQQKNKITTTRSNRLQQNEVIPRQQANAVNNNRPRFQKGKQQLQRKPVQTTKPVHNHVDAFANRMINPKFQALFPTRGNIQGQPLKNLDIIPNRSRLADVRRVTTTTKLSNLPQAPKRVSFDDEFYQEKLRSFFGLSHSKGAQSHSHNKIGLRR